LDQKLPRYGRARSGSPATGGARSVTLPHGHLAPDFIAKAIQEKAPTFGIKLDQRVASIAA
jgi:hypothetical protein